MYHVVFVGISFYIGSRYFYFRVASCVRAPCRSSAGKGADSDCGEARRRSAASCWADCSEVWAAWLQAGRPEASAGIKTKSTILTPLQSPLIASVIKVSEDLLAQHYQQLRSKPFYPDLVQYMTSGPVVVMVSGSLVPMLPSFYFF